MEGNLEEAETRRLRGVNRSIDRSIGTAVDRCCREDRDNAEDIVHDTNRTKLNVAMYREDERETGFKNRGSTLVGREKKNRSGGPVETIRALRWK